MNNNIYPKNYFTPYEDLQTPDEIPAEIKADSKAFEIVDKLKKRIEKTSLHIFNKMNYRFCYNTLLKNIELETAEILEELYKLKGE